MKTFLSASFTLLIALSCVISAGATVIPLGYGKNTTGGAGGQIAVDEPADVGGHMQDNWKCAV